MDLYVGDEYDLVDRPQTAGNSLQNQIIAISKSLARTQINWTLEQRKLFSMCLSKIAWSKGDNSNIVTLDKKEIIDSLGLKIDASDQSRYLRQAFQKLARNSEVHWTDPNDKDEWSDDFLIYGRKSTRGHIQVTFNPEFMPHLQNLAKSYITFLTDDIYGFKSNYSYILFHELRLNCDTRQTNWRDYTTNQLRALFGIGENEYMRKDGQFNRSVFESKVLDRAIAEINQTNMIQILPFKECEAIKSQKDGKLYEKIKEYGYVKKYRFKYVVRTKTTPPHDKYDPMGKYLDN